MAGGVAPGAAGAQRAEALRAQPPAAQGCGPLLPLGRGGGFSCGEPPPNGVRAWRRVSPFDLSNVS